MTQISTLRVFGDPVDENAVAQIETCMRDDHAVAGALMADHHKGYSMPIGGVIAYEDAISPSGVGFDIACGNKAVKTDLSLEDLSDGHATADAIKPIMRQIQKKVSFGMGRSNEERVDHELFERPVWQEIRKFDRGLIQRAQAQLGTVGSGNHYVDLLVDEESNVWVANHFGSRGLGHTLATGIMNLIDGQLWNAKLKEREEPYVVGTDTALGGFYLAAMELAGEYAYAGRDYVIDTALGILGARAIETVHNHHNYAWFEDGLWVVRKGATPLTSESAFIGGSMGDVSVIVRGCWSGAQVDGEALDQGSAYRVSDIGALGSAPHGAGRVMSRTAAAGKIRRMWVCTNRDCRYAERAILGETATELCPDCGGTKFKKLRIRDKTTARIDWDATRAQLTARGIVVLGGGADEAPGVYKDLMSVLEAHPNIEILEILRPLGVVMAGPDVRDPYAD